MELTAALVYQALFKIFATQLTAGNLTKVLGWRRGREGKVN